MEREKGQDVASMSCPNCGSDTPLVAMPDGGMAQGVCPNCYDAEPERDTAAEQPAQQRREKTTTVNEAPKQEEIS